jgi:hypothetical protein
LFAVKAKVVKELLADEEWSKRLEAARTMREVEEVIRQFAKAKGWKIKEVKIHG